jgi:hypothetical protein
MSSKQDISGQTAFHWCSYEMCLSPTIPSLHVQLLLLVTDTRAFVMFHAAQKPRRTLPADEADNVHLIVGLTQVHRTSDC